MHSLTDEHTNWSYIFLYFCKCLYTHLKTRQWKISLHIYPRPMFNVLSVLPWQTAFSMRVLYLFPSFLLWIICKHHIPHRHNKTNVLLYSAFVDWCLFWVLRKKALKVVCHLVTEIHIQKFLKLKCFDEIDTSWWQNRKQLLSMPWRTLKGFSLYLLLSHWIWTLNVLSSWNPWWLPIYTSWFVNASASAMSEGSRVVFGGHIFNTCLSKVITCSPHFVFYLVLNWILIDFRDRINKNTQKA